MVSLRRRESNHELAYTVSAGRLELHSGGNLVFSLLSTEPNLSLHASFVASRSISSRRQHQNT